MKKLRKEDLKQEVFNLYDKYAHNVIGRREFIERLSVYAVGGITLSALLGFVMPNYQGTMIVNVNDQRLKCEFIHYNSPKGGGMINGLLSKPSDSNEKLPGIVVVHENRGLNPYIEDVGRQAAMAGFITLAPDALTPLGGYPGNDDDGREMQRKRDRTAMLEDFIAAYNFLKNHEECNGRVGVVGFCFGGWVANMMAVQLPGLAAAVPFYGGQPTKEETAQIKSSLMLHYAGLDSRINDGWPEYEKALKEYNIDFEAFIYPDVNHGFHNTTTPRYDKEAATLAWGRTIDFFRKKLIASY